VRFAILDFLHYLTFPIFGCYNYVLESLVTRNTYLVSSMHPDQFYTGLYSVRSMRNGIPLSFEQLYLHMLSLLLSGTHVLLYSVLLSSLAEYSSVLVIH
jgi:hypothetical protein